jgi:hypothetical protein
MTAFNIFCAGLIGTLFGVVLAFFGYRLFLILLPFWGFFFGLFLGANTVQWHWPPYRCYRLGGRCDLCRPILSILYSSSGDYCWLPRLFRFSLFPAQGRYEGWLPTLAHRHRRRCYPDLCNPPV